MRDTASSAFACHCDWSNTMPSTPTSNAPHLLPARVVTGAQLRAGRAMLGWSSQTLATAARVHINTVGRWEAAQTLPAFLLREPYGVRRMREAMESAGVKFFIRPSPGVRLCKGPSFVMPPTRRHRPLHGVSRFLQLSCDRRPKTLANQRRAAFVRRAHARWRKVSAQADAKWQMPPARRLLDRTKDGGRTGATV